MGEELHVLEGEGPRRVLGEARGVAEQALRVAPEAVSLRLLLMEEGLRGPWGRVAEQHLGGVQEAGLEGGVDVSVGLQ